MVYEGVECKKGQCESHFHTYRNEKDREKICSSLKDNQQQGALLYIKDNGILSYREVIDNRSDHEIVLNYLEALCKN